MPVNRVSVWVGLTDQRNLSSWSRQIRAEKIVDHEGYDDVNTINDISLIKLVVI